MLTVIEADFPVFIGAQQRMEGCQPLWREQAGRGLLLVDCKYELGLIDDQLVLIDELHTPDSSRYWLNQPGDPVQLSKEFFREWLLSQGADRVIDIPPVVAQAISERYLDLHQRLLGRDLPAPEEQDAQSRIYGRLKGILCAS